ncbi:MAG: pilus assembly protein TadG-related protein [Frankiaceae bacterium]
MRPTLARRRHGHDDDRGAFAILYAVLMIALIGIAALVVDISTMRSDRRVERASADAGASAGAFGLAFGPRQACTIAMKAAFANLAQPLVTSCGTFPVAATTCTGVTSSSASATSGPYTVQVTWPVPDADAMMTTPDNRPATVTQTTVQMRGTVIVDGKPCSRVAVQVSRSSPFQLASVFNVLGSGSQSNSGSTSGTSVALSIVDTSFGAQIAPLVVLDRGSCEALKVDGGALVDVKTALDGGPGIIAADSDGSGRNPNGSAADVACNGNSTVYDASNNSHLYAWSGSLNGASTPGRIYSWAETAGNFSTAYLPAQTTGCVAGSPPTGAQLCPVPTLQPALVGRTAFDNKYNCKAANGCTSATPTSAYIDQLTAAATAVQSNPPAGWTVINGQGCTQSAPKVFPAGNYYVNCTGNNGFKVSTQTAFKGGVVVFKGDVNVGSNGNCLVLNAPSTVTTTAGLSTFCSTATAVPIQANDGYPIYVGGQLNVGSNANFLAPQTMIYVVDQMTVAGGGNLQWTAPYGTHAASPHAATSCVPGGGSTFPSAACFEDLDLWTEYAPSNTETKPDQLSGQAYIHLEGAYFVPSDKFKISGSPTGDQKKAQFIAKRLWVTGGGQLILQPDATREVPNIFPPTSTLIR